MPQALTDEEVVRLSLVDKEQVATLIARYEAKLLRYLERLGVGSSDDRKDVLQNSFIKAYRNLNNFDPALSFSTWMYRITHNEAISFFRYKHSRPVVVLDEDNDSLLALVRDESADTAAVAEANLSAAEVASALQKLPVRYRDVLTLRYFEDRSYEE